MSEETKMDEKAYHYLLHLLDNYKTKSVYEFLRNSELSFLRSQYIRNTFGDILIIRVDPEIYRINQDSIKDISKIISTKLREISGINIIQTKVFPQIEKYQYTSGKLILMPTPWEEINDASNNLLEKLREANSSHDYQNIGNSSRILLQKLSNIVFDPLKHICDDPIIKLDSGHFKNRLHTVIKIELTGKKNKEMREIAESLITTAEKSIDLTNKLTHDLEASKKMGEITVISVISVISIIKNLV